MTSGTVPAPQITPTPHHHHAMLQRASGRGSPRSVKIPEVQPDMMVGMRRDLIVALVGSACAVMALAIQPGTDRGIISALMQANGNTASWVVIFLALSFFGRHVLRQVRVDRSSVRAATITGLILGGAWLVGQALAVTNSLRPLGPLGVQGIAKSLIMLSGFSWLMFIPCGWLFAWNYRRKAQDVTGDYERSHRRTSKTLTRLDTWISKHPRKVLILVFSTFLVIRCAWLWILYPGVVSKDSADQINQGLGLVDLSSHHPVIHTLIIGVFVRLGNALGSVGVGVGFFNLIQVMVTSAVLVFVLWRIRAWGVSMMAVGVVYLVFLIYPIHGIYSVTMWKDIPFGYAVLLLVTVCVDLIRSQRQGKRYWYLAAALLISGTATYVFKSNGPYVLIATVITICIILRHDWKRIVPIAIAPVVLGAGLIFTMDKTLDPIPGEQREALSIPLQQIARVCRYSSEELTPSQVEFVAQLFSGLSPDQVGQKYLPWISDPVKAEANDEFITDFSGFIRGWASIGRDHPQEYLTSFLAGGYGYWYPSTDRWVALTEVTNVDDSNVLTERHSGFGRITSEDHPILVEVLNDYLLNPRNIPIVSMAWSPGFLSWLALIGVFAGIQRNRTKYAWAMAVPLGVLWLTCLASPVYSEYRYMYGLVLSLPIVLVVGFANWRDPHRLKDVNSGLSMGSDA